MGCGASKRPKKEALKDALRRIPASRPGLPTEDSVREVDTFVSPQGEEYQILRTTETDAYDKLAKQESPRGNRAS